MKQIITMVWEGISIEVSFSPHDIMAHAHLELRTDGKVKLPVTETGYRSHFLPLGIVEAAGGPEAFVAAWLDEEAKSAAWRRQQAKDQQLSLF